MDNKPDDELTDMQKAELLVKNPAEGTKLSKASEKPEPAPTPKPEPKK